MWTWHYVNSLEGTKEHEVVSIQSENEQITVSKQYQEGYSEMAKCKHLLPLAPFPCNITDGSGRNGALEDKGNMPNSGAEGYWECFVIKIPAW